MPTPWFSPRSLLLHLGLAAWVLACVAAAWWQVGRAVSGNAYSYLYAVEWPVFAVAGVACWWRLVHADVDGRVGRDALRERADAALAAERSRRRDRSSEDESLAAYNDHLERLAAAGRRKEWRR